MSTENLEKWFDELVIQLEDWLEHRTTLDDEDGVLGSALAGWRFAVERDALEGAAFSIPALYRVGPQELRAGILAQTGEIRFAYTHQTKNEETFFVPISEIAREYTENKQDNEIRFRAFRARYCFTPAGGQQAVQQFWSRCRIPARVLRGTQLKRHGYSRLTGVGSFIRLTTGMGSVVESKPTWLLAHSDGIGVVAPGPAGKSRFTGQNLAIEIDDTMVYMNSIRWRFGPNLLPSSIKIDNRA